MRKVRLVATTRNLETKITEFRISSFTPFSALTISHNQAKLPPERRYNMLSYKRCHKFRRHFWTCHVHMGKHFTSKSKVFKHWLPF